MSIKLLNNILNTKKIDQDLAQVISTIARAGKFVAHAIRTGDLGLAGTSNLFGENQLALDVLADKIFTEHLSMLESVRMVASEEKDETQIINEKGKYCIAYDPIDGSSLIDTNLSVGGIFGIFENQDFIGQKCRNMIASCYLVFGPRTIFCIGFKNINKVLEFTMNDLGEFFLTNNEIEVKSYSKTFSPGNLRACIENEKYKKLIDFWCSKPLTLRYSGGMVPDIHQIFVKGGGIFAYPPFSKYPNGKLRLLFECGPLAFLMEKAGGKAVNDQGINILDIEIRKVHQRCPIFIGSSREVERCGEFLDF